MLKPSPLAIFDKGLDEDLCTVYKINWDSGIFSYSNQKEFSNEVFHLFDTPDLFYVTWIFLSLCAVLFSFNLVTGEKEDGTLRQMLASSLSRSKLVAGKWAGGFICLVLPLTLAFLVSLTVVSLAPNVQFGLQDCLKLALFLAGSLLYLEFFFSLGMLISTASRNSAAALSVSLLLWVTLVFVAPGLGNVVAGKIVAVPSNQRYMVQSHQAYMAYLRARDDSDRKTSSREAFDLRQHDPEKNDLVSDYRARLDWLVSLSRAFIRLSPAGAYTFLAGDLSNTGMLELLNLKHSILVYRDIFLGFPHNENLEVVGDYPAFIYERLTLTQILINGGLLNLALLLLHTAVVFAASYVLFLRYDAR
jgi:ABC-type transport system involved in multi-copper enzyme maturation permease subunit